MRMMIGTCEYAVYAEFEEPMPTMALVWFGESTLTISNDNVTSSSVEGPISRLAETAPEVLDPTLISASSAGFGVCADGV